MQLFYQPTITSIDEIIYFNREEGKHIVKVLRKQAGEHVMVTNGQGLLFTIELTNATPNKVEGKIISTQTESPRPINIHLAVAPTKSNDRYEWFLEKAVEIGVDEITPIICERSERRHINKSRFERILQSAMKQSLRLTMPIVNEASSFDDFIQGERDLDQFKGIAHCEESPKQMLKNIAPQFSRFLILIGPEGDFSHNEITLAKQKGYHEITLGKSRLRTETAAVVACHTLNLLSVD